MTQQQSENNITHNIGYISKDDIIKTNNTIVLLYINSYLYNDEYYMAIIRKYISDDVFVIIHYEVCKGYIEHAICHSLSDFEYLCKNYLNKLYVGS